MKKFLMAVFGIVAAAALIFVVMNSLPSKPVKGKDAHGHGGGAHEEHGEGVTLSDAKVKAAGIELLKAGPATLRDSLQLNGVLQPNQEALVQVTPRFPGVVREVTKRVGESVAKNDLLARIESNQSLTVYDVRSPIAGTIIDRQVSLGEYVNEQKSAFVITDLSTVWADLSVYRRDMKRVQLNDKVLIEPNDGGAPIEASISYISPVGSADTQSSLARAVVANPDQRLRPGLFVSAKLVLSAKDVGIAVKANAIQTVENRSVVFVREGEKFEARDVELGARDAEWIEVLFGISEGDVYAAKNSFVIKAEIGKGSAAHEH